MLENPILTQFAVSATPVLVIVFCLFIVVLVGFFVILSFFLGFLGGGGGFGFAFL